jgi:cellulose synthase/poly-beta-1,6-N-acetylglucosamine synthase-like glycosyltransferase
LIYLSWLLIACYGSLLLTFYYHWRRIRITVTAGGVNSSPLKLSIIIPVRNEGNNILFLLQDLAKQQYPRDFFEVIVVDDQSTDATVDIVNKFSIQHPFVRLFHLQDNGSKSFKKRALELGIEKSSGEIIITTDGDCRLKEYWLQTIGNFYKSTNAICICGPVTYITEPKFFNHLQMIEFAALLGSGAATIQMKQPGMCNGANFSYKKEVFKEVEGFANIDGIASGDDELLMHKILGRYPSRVYFLKDESAIVETKANPKLKDFYQQRKRWAGKWSFYKSLFVKTLALFIFAFNLYFAAGWLLVILGWIDLKMFLIHYLLKALIEGFFIVDVLKFLKKKIHLFPFVLLQILYPFYTTFFGIVANFGGYEWKGRNLK